jgi:hypothetical protein
MNDNEDGGHAEYIVCPKCNDAQMAWVEHTPLFWSYVHQCRKCEYTIMESEWKKYDKNADKEIE